MSVADLLAHFAATLQAGGKALLSSLDQSGAADGDVASWDDGAGEWVPVTPGAASHPNLSAHDALGLATDAELATHAGAADPHPGYLTAAEGAAAYDAIGAAAAAQSASQPLDADLTAIAALTTTGFGRAFLELANAGAGRTYLGLGSAALSATGDFDAAGAAAAAQAASQPMDSDLTALAALSTTAYGRSLLEAANAAGARTLLGLGTAAVAATGDFDAVGAAAAAQAASQPLDSDLTAFAGLAIAADKLPYGTGSHTLGLADFTAAGRALVDDADAAAQRTTLGLGTAAVAAAADFQPVDADLTAIAALATTAFGRAVLAWADAAAGRTYLGLGTAALSATGDFQPIDSDLTAIAALTTTAYGRSLLEAANAAAARTLLGLGTAAVAATGDFDAAGAAAAAQSASQPLDSDLTALAGLALVADTLPYGNGSHTMALATFTAAGRALIDDADAAAQRTTLGLGTAAVAATGDFDAAGVAVSTVNLLDWKASARLATEAALAAYTRTVNVILANANGALATIDGVAPAVGDRILLKNGAAGADNGIYVVDSLGAVGAKWQMTRATDADASAEVTNGLTVVIDEGTINAHTIYNLQTNDPITLNTTALTFARIAGGLVKAAAATVAMGPDSTWLVLAANSGDITGVGQTVVMTITGVGVGRYHFRCQLVYQTTVGTTGIDVSVNHTGTLTQFIAEHRFASTGAAATTANASEAETGGTGATYEAQGKRTINSVIGAGTVGVDTANTDMLSTIEGFMVVSVSGDFQIKMAAEAAALVCRAMQGSFLELKKLS